MIAVVPHPFLDGRWLIQQDGKDAGELVIYKTGDAFSVALNGNAGMLWRGMLKNGRVYTEPEYVDWALRKREMA